jgi:hypothetical protein
MPELTPMDELFVHRIPEPLPNVATAHDHCRESLMTATRTRWRSGRCASTSGHGERREHSLHEVTALVADHVAEQRVGAAGQLESGRA